MKSDEIKPALAALRESIRKLTKIPLFLIVEDNQIDAEVLSLQLKEFLPKCQILVCDNGMDALSILDHQNIDAVFLDLKLPGMDGLEVMRQVRHRDKVVLVIVTGLNGETEMALEAIKLGAVKVVVKPVTQTNLKDIFSTI